MKLFNKVFGTKNEREIKALQPMVEAIKAHEPALEKKSDADLASRLAEIRASVDKHLAAVKKPDPADDPKHKMARERINGALDPHLPEVFALVREAGKRVLGMRHYDVQMIGGITLHKGRIGEMRTGEGKTLVATLPSVLNALTGDGVHVVTVNDYLASRDAEWMGRLYRFLGLSVGVVVAHQGTALKHEAYASDITYGQNNEFGFDYLRDNMKFSLDDYVQKRGHAFAVIDEVDSILIDEARTPLIISGPSDDPIEMYIEANKIVPKLRKDEHFTIDEKSRQVLLTEAGVERCEGILGLSNLYDPDNMEILHHVTQALRAHALYKRDSHYVVEDGEVVIVDDHTGRLMHGRRWSEGLHGAVEAKEGVSVQAETQTLATVTFQNFFRMYTKLGGMTGTADTEAEEFAKIYDLDVLVIPTNKPIVRDDQDDLVYKTEPEKINSVVEDIKEKHSRKQPVLVGTVSVEKSEVFSNQLRRLGIPHNVLNAKRHRDEAGIVAQAGRLGGVTIATNMAGRGTDILLGGSPEFMARTAVAARMGQGDEQVAEFAFLTGRSDLINIEKLAERDRTKVEYVAPYEEMIRVENERLQAIADEGGEPVPRDDIPHNRKEIGDRIYEQRLEFYKKAIKIYDEVLPGYEAECSAEKEKVKAAGGLHIIGTERHESRRIDNQLRGRAGRQGDPGSSRFYLCLQDDLMRIFGSDKMIRVMEMLGMEDGVPIEHNMVSKSIANAQKRVEGQHFDGRKNVLEYDDVMNQQRKSIYSLRREVLEAEYDRQEEAGAEDPGLLMRELLLDLVEEAIVNSVMTHCPEKMSAAEWDLAGIASEMENLLGVHIDIHGLRRDRDAIMDGVFAEVERVYKKKEDEEGAEQRRQLENFLYLQTIDARWKEHLQHMDHLREGIHMRGYAQKDPKQEYKKEGYQLFLHLRARIRDEVLEKVFKSQIASDEDEVERMRRQRAQRAAREAQNRAEGRDAAAGAAPGGAPAARPAANGRIGNLRPMAAPQLGGNKSAPPRPAPGATPSNPNPFGQNGQFGLPKPGAGGGGGQKEGLNRAQRRRQKAGTKKRLKPKKGGVRAGE